MEAFEGEATGLSVLAVYNVLARALLAQGKVAEAHRIIEKARSLEGPVSDRCSSLAFEATSARVRAASDNEHDVAAALRTLEVISAEADRSSCYPVGIEARFAQVQIEARSQHLTAAARDLVTLQREAATRGFSLITRRTEALQRELSRTK
jgi:hypothetical protein